MRSAASAKLLACGLYRPSCDSDPRPHPGTMPIDPTGETGRGEDGTLFDPTARVSASWGMRAAGR